MPFARQTGGAGLRRRWRLSHLPNRRGRGCVPILGPTHRNIRLLAGETEARFAGHPAMRAQEGAALAYRQTGIIGDHRTRRLHLYARRRKDGVPPYASSPTGCIVVRRCIRKARTVNCNHTRPHSPGPARKKAPRPAQPLTNTTARVNRPLGVCGVRKKAAVNT